MVQRYMQERSITKMTAIKLWFIEGYEQGIIKTGYKSAEDAANDLISIKRFDEEKNGITDQYTIDYEYL